MEKEDKIIKALLNDKFIDKAPEGFTGRVMQSIEAVELQQQEQPNAANWLYWLVILGSILLALGIISFIDGSFISQYYLIFGGYISGFFYQITNMFSHSVFTDNSILSGSGLVIGIFVIMTVLLFFDGFIFKKKRYMNLFVFSF